MLISRVQLIRTCWLFLPPSASVPALLWEVGVACVRSEEPSAAASQPNVFDLSEKFPCTSGINLNLPCFARELPRAVANLVDSEWEAGFCSTSCVWWWCCLDFKPGKSFFVKDAKLAGVVCVR